MRRLCRRGRCWRGGCEESLDAETQRTQREERKRRKAKGKKERHRAEACRYETSLMLSYEQARNKVIEEVGKRRGPRATAGVSVWEALGLVLAQEVKTDREYPPFDRSTRDGYAVHSNDAASGAQLKCVRE